MALIVSTSLLGGCAITDNQGSIVLKVAQASNENEQLATHRFESERKISKDFQKQLYQDLQIFRGLVIYLQLVSMVITMANGLMRTFQSTHQATEVF